MAEIDRELGWEDSIENDGSDFELLPAGDYDFEVVGFERGRHPGSDKLPACNKAIISIKVSGAAGSTTIKHNLFLHTKTEGLLSAFFVGIGQKKKGERVTMNWSQVVCSKGRCKVGVREWTGSNDGKKMTNNQIVKFYEPEDKPAGFVPGKF